MISYRYVPTNPRADAVGRTVPPRPHFDPIMLSSACWGLSPSQSPTSESTERGGHCANYQTKKGRRKKGRLHQAYLTTVTGNINFIKDK